MCWLQFQTQVYRADFGESRDSGKRETQCETNNSGRELVFIPISLAVEQHQTIDDD